MVVDVGETLCDPLTATVAPFRVALTAFVEAHVSVELPPEAMETGLALIPAVGPLAPTVTMAWAVAVAPAAFLAIKVYVVVAVGDTVCDPLTATAAPFRVALVAFVDDHVRVELPPAVMVVGFALMPAVGAPLPPVTVTVAWPQSVAPARITTRNAIRGRGSRRNRLRSTECDRRAVQIRAHAVRRVPRQRRAATSCNGGWVCNDARSRWTA